MKEASDPHNDDPGPTGINCLLGRYRYSKERKGDEKNLWWGNAEFFAGKKFDPLRMLRRVKEGSRVSIRTE